MTEALQHRKNDRLAALRGALGQGTLRSAHRMVNALHPAEIAKLIESLPPAQREVVWEFVDPELEGEVLVELNEDVRAGADRGHGRRTSCSPRPRAWSSTTSPTWSATCPRPSPAAAEVDGRAGPRAPEHGAALRGGQRRRPHEHRHRERARRTSRVEVVLRYLRMRGELPEHTDRLFVVDRHDQLPRQPSRSRGC